MQGSESAPGRFDLMGRRDVIEGHLRASQEMHATPFPGELQIFVGVADRWSVTGRAKHIYGVHWYFLQKQYLIA
jgi:hypothetical protein